MNTILRFVATAVVSFVIYLLLTASLGLAEILFGTGVALIAAVLVSRYLPIHIGALNPVRIAKAIIYLPVFFWKMIEANLKLALIVIRPSLPIAPSIVRGTSGLKSGEGKLFLTSSITLTPGTLTVDVDEDEVRVAAGPDGALLRVDAEDLRRRGRQHRRDRLERQSVLMVPVLQHDRQLDPDPRDPRRRLPHAAALELAAPP